MSDVIPFPQRALPPQQDDVVGPAVGARAWVCNHCDEDETQFMFYVLERGVHCWTCHREQSFP